MLSPVIDLGNDDLIQSDVTDVDDGGPAGPIPWDYKKFDRVIPPGPPPTGDPGYVDFGSYEECPGDIDGNGQVDISDLAALLACFGTTACETSSPGCCRCDIQGCNSAVDIADLSLLLSLFGRTCEPTLGLDGPSAEATMLAEDPMTQWIRSATPEEVLDWWYAGMPPVDEWDR